MPVGLLFFLFTTERLCSSNKGRSILDVSLSTRAKPAKTVRSPFLCLSLKTEIIFSISTLILAVIAIKQMSGFSYLNTIWRMIVALVPFFFLIVFLFAVGYLLLLLYAYIKFI